MTEKKEHPDDSYYDAVSGWSSPFYPEYPSLNWSDTETRKINTVHFTDIDGEPYAVFYEELDPDPLVFVPRYALLIAYEEGWAGRYKSKEEK